jgi:hypothetical protein
MIPISRILSPIILLVFLKCGSQPVSTGEVTDETTMELWRSCFPDGSVQPELLQAAMTGYHRTDSLRKKNILTIMDMTRPSSAERFYVIDVDHRKLLYRCLVAHGRNSGDEFAKSFSDRSGSLQSSLGFYLTAETYYGKHGYSLKLDGLEKGFNANARSREIVIHGADYVSREFIRKYGRLGRSWGCPALPEELSEEIIDSISNGSCLFIYAEDETYLRSSAFISDK